jgi:hypothetical protein
MTEYEYVPLVGWSCPQCLAVTDSDGRCNCGVNQGLRVRTHVWSDTDARICTKCGSGFWGINQKLCPPCWEQATIKARNTLEEMESRNQQTYENLVASTPKDLGIESDVKFKRCPPGETI